MHAIHTETIKTARTITGGLAPPFPLADNLSEALKWPAEHVRSNYGLSLEARIVGQTRPIPEAKGMLLYTAARELLLNVVKHAGTREAQMEFYPRSNGITLVVRDAGLGFNPGASIAKHREGFGLLSIRERVRLLDGEFCVDSAPGTGSEVAATIPIPWRPRPSRTRRHRPRRAVHPSKQAARHPGTTRSRWLWPMTTDWFGNPSQTCWTTRRR